MQATELQALARQPQRIAGARLPDPSSGDYLQWIQLSAALGALVCAGGALSLLLVADPEHPPTQLAFYAALLVALFQAGFAAAVAWVRRRPRTGKPWRAGAAVGLTLTAAAGLSLLGLRLGLGPIWTIPPLLLPVLSGLAWKRFLRG